MRDARTIKLTDFNKVEEKAIQELKKILQKIFCHLNQKDFAYCRRSDEFLNYVNKSFFTDNSYDRKNRELQTKTRI